MVISNAIHLPGKFFQSNKKKFKRNAKFSYAQCLGRSSLSLEDIKYATNISIVLSISSGALQELTSH